MRPIIAYFLRFPIWGNALMWIIILFGIFSFLRIKTSFFPEYEPPIIQVDVVYPGASPEEVEEGITIKIEESLKGLESVERTLSFSRENIASITIELFKGTDVDEVLQDVKNAISSINNFPQGIENPTIFKRKGRTEVAKIAIYGSVSLSDLKKEAELIEEKLLAEKGISQINFSGFPDQEIEIGLSEFKLRQYDLSFDEVYAILKQNNLEVSGGLIRNSEREFIIRSDEKGLQAQDFKDVILRKFSDGRKVLLSEVSIIKDQFKEGAGKNYYNGLPCAIIEIDKTNEEDIISIIEQVNDFTDQYNSSQEKVTAEVIVDRSVDLKQRIDLLSRNGLIGFFLVLLFLSIFLNYRIAFWVALSIPISFLGMFMLAPYIGLNINNISLFGMIIVIGILVDDGIVIAENIYQYYEKGKSRFEAALLGTLNVLPSVFAAILTTIIAFIPLYFIEGTWGYLIPHMATVGIVTISFSLIEAMFILPSHLAHSKALKEKKPEKGLRFQFERFLIRIRENIYSPILEFCLQNKWLSLSVSVVGLMLTAACIKGDIIKTTFFPFIDGNRILVDLKMEPGTSEERTLEVLKLISEQAGNASEEISEKYTLDQKVIQGIYTITGPNSYQGQVNLILLDEKSRNLPSFEVAERIRELVGSPIGIKQLAFSTGQRTFSKPVSISISGKDISELLEVGKSLKSSLKSTPELTDVIDDSEKGIEEIELKLTDKGELLGASQGLIMDQVRTAFFGKEVQVLQRGDDEVKVWLRYRKENRQFKNQLDNMEINLGGARRIPLKELADYSLTRKVVSINHLDGKKQITVEADLKDQNAPVPPIIEKINTQVLPGLQEQYPSISFSYQGQKRENDKTAKSAYFTAVVAIIAILAVVTLAFKSFMQTFLVLMTLPLALISIAWGHYLHGLPLSMLSLFGVIALVGVLVNDALVMINTFNQYMREGMDFNEAVREAAVNRFRAVILTSITTIVGLLPMVLETSRQAQFLIPMAISLSYGLIMATIVTLIILPILLILANYVRRYWYQFKNGSFPKPEIVEPAVREQFLFED
ncbi:MAG: efflux RND transporter permease subunit [Bacteroidota bacterium]